MGLRSEQIVPVKTKLNDLHNLKNRRLKKPFRNLRRGVRSRNKSNGTTTGVTRVKGDPGLEDEGSRE